jgi:uncharacterized protein YtpQ (UPF0354 family)
MNLADESLRTLSAVVPRMYVALPKAVPADVTLTELDSPVETRLVADLIIFYAFDVGSHYEIVSKKDLTRLGLTKEELHDRALQNLRSLRLEVRVNQGDRIMMLTAGGNYEATLLLLPEIWSSVAQMVSGQIVASVPARDILYVTGDSDHENLADLRRWTSKMIEQADKPLSRVFIRWSGTQWEEYSGYSS